MIVPAPLTKVHKPVPTVAAFPANVAVVPQTVWFGPAAEVVGGATPVIVTLLVVEAQGGFEIVHMKTFGPTPKAVTPDVGEVGVVIVPEPLTNDHDPVPTLAAFPASVAVVPHILWLAPAAATVVAADPVIVTVDEDDAQGAFEIVH